jgi:hypothetical protein
MVISLKPDALIGSVTGDSRFDKEIRYFNQALDIDPRDPVDMAQQRARLSQNPGGWKKHWPVSNGSERWQGPLFAGYRSPALFR